MHGPGNRGDWTTIVNKLLNYNLTNQERLLNFRRIWRLWESMAYAEFIERNPAICGGVPVLRGTRVTLKSVLASLAEGATPEEVLADFPTLSPDHIRAVIAFAAASAGEDVPVSPIPDVA